METQNVESRVSGGMGESGRDAFVSVNVPVKKSHGDFGAMFGRVSNEFKIVMVGSVLAFLGCFLPWWSISSTGAYATNNTINAFSGATFFLGFVVFLGAIFSMMMMFFELMDRESPFFKKVSPAVMQMLIGGQMTILMMVALSIFTSPSFSTESVTGNISSGVSYGTFIVALGSVMILIGGWLEWKGKDFLKDKLGKTKKINGVKVNLNDDLRVNEKMPEMGVDIERREGVKGEE